MHQVLRVIFFIALSLASVTCNRLHHNDPTESKGFHYHYEVLPSTLPVQGSSSSAMDTMKVEESRSAFGYRKPSSEYRVVDFLADAYGFSRKNTFNFPTSTTTTTTSSPPTSSLTTTASPVTMSPVRSIPSRAVTISTDYLDDTEEDEDTTTASSPPPAPLRSTPSKTSPPMRFTTEQVKMNLDTDTDDEMKSMFPASPGRMMKQTLKERNAQIEQEKEREESTTTTPTTMSPFASLKTQSGRLISQKLNQGSSVDYDTKTTARQVTTATPAPTTTSSPVASIDEDSTLLTDSMRNRISIHQLVSESMPSVSMSIVPVYFVNRVTKSVITVPYLTMKSISKMPLLPGMYGGDKSANLPSMNGLVKLQSHRIQRGNVKSGPSLFKLLQSGSTNNQMTVDSSHSESTFDDNKSSESSDSRTSESDWIPINVNNNANSGVTSISDSW